MKHRRYKFGIKSLVMILPLFLLACASEPSESDGWDYNADSDGYNRLISYTESDDLTKEFLIKYEGTWTSVENPEVAIIIENEEIEIGLHTDYETYPAKGFEIQSSEWAFESDGYKALQPIYSMIIDTPTYFSDHITTMNLTPINSDSEMISDPDYAFTFIVGTSDGQNQYYNMEKSEIQYNESSGIYTDLEETEEHNILVEGSEFYSSSEVVDLTNQFLDIHEGVWEDPNFPEVLFAIEDENVYFSYYDDYNIYPVDGFEFESFNYDGEIYYGNGLLLSPPLEYSNIISGLNIIPGSFNPERQTEQDYIFFLRVHGVNGSSISYNMHRTDYSLNHHTTESSSENDIRQDNSTSQSKKDYSTQDNKVYENNKALKREEVYNKYSENQLNNFGIQSEPTQVDSDGTFKIEFQMGEDIDLNDFKYNISGEKVSPSYTGENSNGIDFYTIKGHFDWIKQYTDYRFRFGDDYFYYIVLEVLTEDDMIIFEDYTDYISY